MICCWARGRWGRKKNKKLENCKSKHDMDSSLINNDSSNDSSILEVWEKRDVSKPTSAELIHSENAPSESIGETIELSSDSSIVEVWTSAEKNLLQWNQQAIN